MLLKLIHDDNKSHQFSLPGGVTLVLKNVDQKLLTCGQALPAAHHLPDTSQNADHERGTFKKTTMQNSPRVHGHLARLR